ncbi:hypothetical protein EK904_002805 [Melospiza melodia maxima]|nr:hypothetical protein EK904_002805 [Melospiza melodia maxima]
MNATKAWPSFFSCSPTPRSIADEAAQLSKGSSQEEHADSASRNHSQVSRVPVAIKVLDVNDNAPEFASEHEAFLCENGKPGQVIQIVSAVDKDDPKNGHYFLYSLLPEMVNNPNFTIKKNEGNFGKLCGPAATCQRLFHNGTARGKAHAYDAGLQTDSLSPRPKPEVIHQVFTGLDRPS